MNDEFASLWITVPNWDKFQHYKDRNVPWIKTYLDLHHRDEYLELPVVARALLHDVWLAYAAADTSLRVRSVSRLAPVKTRSYSRRETWEALVHAGFITLSSSRPLDQRERERERQREREKKQTQSRKAVTSEVDVESHGFYGSGFEFDLQNLIKDVPK